ncbi:MAG TPA: hypothetical protein ENN05_12865 [Deltaproteobacteria bacterium]|nr:hypothetical protein [Deltaproteobacteria bacterium]
MNVYDVLKHTILVVVPAGVLVCLIVYALGYAHIAFGLLLGVAGGTGKTLFMTYSAMNDVKPIVSFLLRYIILGIVMVLAIQISMHAFFAAVAGIFFVQIVFIMDQVKASSIGELR